MRVIKTRSSLPIDWSYFFHKIEILRINKPTPHGTVQNTFDIPVNFSQPNLFYPSIFSSFDLCLSTSLRGVKYHFTPSIKPPIVFDVFAWARKWKELFIIALLSFYILV